MSDNNENVKFSLSTWADAEVIKATDENKEEK